LSRSFAKTEGEAKWGKHNQSTDPSFDISAPLVQLPTIP